MSPHSKSPIRVHSHLFAGELLLFCLTSVLGPLSSASAVQQAWIAKYGNGSNTISQAVALSLDKDENIYVAGYATRTNAPFDYDYIIIKYNSLGVQQWANRFGVPSTNDLLKSLVVNTNGEIFVTGNGGTVKYYPNGLPAWNIPYPGRDITADADGNSYVTGFLTNDFSTAKFDMQGSNIWVRTWDHSGYDDVSTAITLDTSNNVLIAGFARESCDRSGCLIRTYVLKYSPAGFQEWVTLFSEGSVSILSEFEGLACDSDGFLYAALRRVGACCAWGIRKFNPAGALVWSTGLSPYANEGVRSMSLDAQGNIYTAGALSSAYSTFKLSSEGTNLWSAAYSGANLGAHRALAIAADSAGNAYVTGQSTGVGTGNDYATIKYGTNGQQLWVKRYTEAGNSDDQAHAIAVAPNGDVYVTGFSNPSPGTYEITTIKYIQASPIEKKSDGNILLSFCGAPGSNYVIEAGSTLGSWTNIGNTTANANGLYTFEDTNAPAFQQRFYRTREE